MQYCGSFILDSDQHSVGGTKAHLRLTIDEKFEIEEEFTHVIRLRNSKIPTTVRTLTAAKGNNSIRYSVDAGATWNQIIFVDQVVSAESIRSGLIDYFEAKGHYNLDAQGNEVYPFEILINISADLGYTQTDIDFLIAGPHDYSDVILDMSNNGTSTFYEIFGFTLATAVHDYSLALDYISTNSPELGDGQFSIIMNILKTPPGARYPGELFRGSLGTDYTLPNSYRTLPDRDIKEISGLLNGQFDVVELRLVDRNGALLLIDTDTSIDSNTLFCFDVFRN